MGRPPTSNFGEWTVPSSPSKSLPMPGSVKEESLEESVKRTRQAPRQRTEVRGETIPDRGTHNQPTNCEVMFGGNASKWPHKVTSGGGEERSVIRASRSQDEELRKIGRRSSKDAVPDDRGDPIMDAVLNREPVGACVGCPGQRWKRQRYGT